MNRFEGVKVLLTGATSGIGRATVARLAAAIAFAASSDGGYLTGANVRVDGGSGT